VPQLSSGQPRRLDVTILAAALDRALANGDASLRETARRLGLAPSTLTRIRQGGRPDAEATVVLMDWLGLEAADLLAPRSASPGARSSERQRAPRPQRGTPRRAARAG
jgi:transcriptional regulator with XRE-family HTH domain